MSYTLNTNHEEWEVEGDVLKHKITSITSSNNAYGTIYECTIEFKRDDGELVNFKRTFSENGETIYFPKIKLVPKFKLSENMDVNTIEFSPKAGRRINSIKASQLHKESFNVSYYDLEMKCDYESLFDQYGYCMVKGSEDWRIVPKQKEQPSTESNTETKQYPDLDPNEWEWHHPYGNYPIIKIENLNDGTYKVYISLNLSYHINAEGNSTISQNPIIRRKEPFPFGTGVFAKVQSLEETKQEYSDAGWQQKVEANTTNDSKYLDETLGKLERDYTVPPNEPSPTLSLLLNTLANLNDSLLKVEAQAFAEYVRTNKGTDIQTDYYKFRKLNYPHTSEKNLNE